MSSDELTTPDVEDQQLREVVEVVVARLAERGGHDTPQDVVQALLTVAAKRYVECRNAGEDFGPFIHDEALNATEVMVTVTNMLHAADIELFELAMWAIPGTSEAAQEGVA